MSIDVYERLAGRFELHKLLGEGLEDIKAGRTIPVDQVFAEIEAGFDEP